MAHPRPGPRPVPWEVPTTTLHRWADRGLPGLCRRTFGGHRRFWAPDAPIDPAFYRSELCLATNGDWHLLRDGQQIAIFPGSPIPALADAAAVRQWASAVLAQHGVTVTEWLNGMDRPAQDWGYWVAEPVDSGAPSGPDLMALYDTLNSLALATVAAAGGAPDFAQPFLIETARAETGAFPPASDEAEALRVLIGVVERQAAVTS